MNEMNLTRIGIENFKFRGIDIENIKDVLDGNEVTIWSYAHDRFLSGKICLRKAGVFLIYRDKFSHELASRAGCVPLSYAPADENISFVKSTWENCDAVLLHFRDENGSPVVYDWRRDLYYVVGLSVPKEWDNKWYYRYGYRIIREY